MKAFNCPQCGATLEFERIEAPLVKCQYCNSLVVVPSELRPPLAQPPPEAPRLNFGQTDQPKRVAFAVVALIVFTAAVGFLIARNSRSNKYGGVNVNPTRTPFRPTPPPTGYRVAYTFGGEGTGPGLFKDSMGVAVDGEGRVYVSDETRRVQRFDPSGQFLNTWDIPLETKWYRKLRGGPLKILANPSGYVYAVLAGVVMKFDGETGEVLGAAHGSDYIQDAALVPPVGAGLLLVSQKGEDDELVQLGIDGRAERRTHRFVSSQLDKKLEVEALRVAAGPGGETYALYCIGGVEGEHSYDDEDIAVFRFSSEGKYLARFGGEGHAPGQYGPPTALAADGRGRVYVLETFDAIHVFEPDGRYVRTLKAPHGVEALAFDLQDNLYVAGGHKVSKLVLDK